MLIQPYRPEWKNDFEKIEAVINRGLAGLAIRLEHVGSTSIEQLASKPIIDIDLIYQDRALFTKIKSGLEALGYYHNGDQGIPGREVFKRKDQGEPHQVLDRIKHHFYVCHSSSGELQRHLAFRDFLRTNEQARAAYEQLKYDIAERAGQDRKVYAELKTLLAREFVENILRRAASDNDQQE